MNQRGQGFQGDRAMLGLEHLALAQMNEVLRRVIGKNDRPMTFAQ